MLTIRLTVFLAATLLFFIQPLIAKHIVPSFGGAYAVWSVVVVFFTTTLLLGYIYASVVMAWPRRIGLLVHGSLLSITGYFLYQQVRAGVPLLGTIAPDLANPSLAVLAALIQLVWLPTFMLASTSVIAQFLYAHSTKEDPYPLYSLSNLGSIIGLLVFPLLLEPFLAMSVVAWIWFALFVAYFCVYGYSCWRYWPRILYTTPEVVTESRATLPWWHIVGIAAVPTFFMVALTEDLAKSIASFPLLWVVPLLLYLLSFVIAFTKRDWPMRTVAAVAGCFSVLGTLVLGSSLMGNWYGYVAYFFIANCALFAVATWLHRYLYEHRPQVGSLGTFYVWLTLGGAVGSAVVSFLLPVLLSSQIELLVLLVVLTIVLYRIVQRELMQELPTLMRSGVTILMCISLMIPIVDYGTTQLLTEAQVRNFYGEISVVDVLTEYEGESSVIRYVLHGSIVHGLQSLDPDYKGEAASYYGPRSGIDHAITYFTDKGVAPRVLVVGVGVGMMSAYCDRVESLDYVDINPLMYDVANEYFTYLELCPEKTGRYEGDGRIWLEEFAASAGKKYDIIMLDAFSDDAIPTHLLTHEAVGEAYAPVLAEDGVIAFHISNKYLDLRPVLFSSLEKNGYEPVSFFTEQTGNSALYQSTPWVLGVAAKSYAWFAAKPEMVPFTGSRVDWRDDKHSIVSVLSLSGSDWE